MRIRRAATGGAPAGPSTLTRASRETLREYVGLHPGFPGSIPPSIPLLIGVSGFLFTAGAKAVRCKIRTTRRFADAPGGKRVGFISSACSDSVRVRLSTRRPVLLHPLRHRPSGRGRHGAPTPGASARAACRRRGVCGFGRGCTPRRPPPASAKQIGERAANRRLFAKELVEARFRADSCQLLQFLSSQIGHISSMGQKAGHSSQPVDHAILNASVAGSKVSSRLRVRRPAARRGPAGRS